MVTQHGIFYDFGSWFSKIQSAQTDLCFSSLVSVKKELQAQQRVREVVGLSPVAIGILNGYFLTHIFVVNNVLFVIKDRK